MVIQYDEDQRNHSCGTIIFLSSYHFVFQPDPNIVEMKTPEGLVRGHAYSITKIIYMDITTPNTTGKIPLLRLRNPWGNEDEWNGPWSDK